jgi:hypothetical protein
MGAKGSRPSPARAAASSVDEFVVTQPLHDRRMSGLILGRERAMYRGSMRLRIEPEALVFCEASSGRMLAAFPYYSILCWGALGSLRHCARLDCLWGRRSQRRSV